MIRTKTFTVICWLNCLSEQLVNSIGADMLPENSWEISREFNPDDQVGWLKRLKLWFYSLLPMDAIL
jgi:hypothetical protein